MSSWKDFIKAKLTRKIMTPALAGALALSLGVYEFARPVRAAAPAPAPAAAPLSDSSVGALLELDRAMEALAARVTPAVVNITVASKAKPESGNLDGNDQDNQQFGPFGGFGRFFGQPSRPQIEHGLGSGVIISPDGYIVTNNHVVQGAVDIRVTMSDKRVFSAKLIGTDPLTDLAVIKISGKDFTSVPLGDSV